MSTEVNANINNSECIKSTTDFGDTIYHNICSGAQHVVPWGAADWLLFWFLATIFLLLVILTINLVKLAIFD